MALTLAEVNEAIGRSLPPILGHEVLFEAFRPSPLSIDAAGRLSIEVDGVSLSEPVTLRAFDIISSASDEQALTHVLSLLEAAHARLAATVEAACPPGGQDPDLPEAA